MTLPALFYLPRLHAVKFLFHSFNFFAHVNFAVSELFNPLIPGGNEKVTYT